MKLKQWRCGPIPKNQPGWNNIFGSQSVLDLEKIVASAKVNSIEAAALTDASSFQECKLGIQFSSRVRPTTLFSSGPKHVYYTLVGCSALHSRRCSVCGDLHAISSAQGSRIGTVAEP